MKYLLDTSVVSETRRKSPDPNVMAWFRRTEPSALHLSVLTLGEIAKGIASLVRRDPAAGRALGSWFDGLRLHYADRLLNVDGDIAEAWGQLSAVRPLPVIDGLIAATALTHGMTLVTRDRRAAADTGVAIIDPWRP